MGKEHTQYSVKCVVRESTELFVCVSRRRGIDWELGEADHHSG